MSPSMNFPNLSFERVATMVAYLVVGMVGTATVALAVLYAGRPIQPWIYSLFYLQVGPSQATKIAILTHFLVSGIAGTTVSMVIGDYLSVRLDQRTALLKVIAVLVSVPGVFLVGSLAKVTPFLIALPALAVAFVAIPLLLRYRYDVRSGAIPAFIGSIPVVVLLLLATAFGIGWGWGYIMTSENVPASSVNGSAAADFDDVPTVREGLFNEDSLTATNGRQVYRLYLRGYEHEQRAATFMARYGVRCPYQQADSWQSDSFIATYNGSYYEITCTPHGD